MTVNLLWLPATIRVLGYETVGCAPPVLTKTRCNGAWRDTPSGTWTRAPSRRKAVFNAGKPSSSKAAWRARGAWSRGPAAATAPAGLVAWAALVWAAWLDRARE